MLERADNHQGRSGLKARTWQLESHVSALSTKLIDCHRCRSRPDWRNVAVSVIDPWPSQLPFSHVPFDPTLSGRPLLKGKELGISQLELGNRSCQGESLSELDDDLIRRAEAEAGDDVTREKTWNKLVEQTWNRICGNSAKHGGPRCS